MTPTVRDVVKFSGAVLHCTDTSSEL